MASGKPGGAFGAGVGHVDHGVFSVDHLHEVFGAADVVDLAVFGVLFFEGLAGLALIPVDGMAEEEIGVAAEGAAVDLLVGHDEEAFVGVDAGAFDGGCGDGDLVGATASVAAASGTTAGGGATILHLHRLQARERVERARLHQWRRSGA